MPRPKKGNSTRISRTILTGSLVALGLVAQPVLSRAFDGEDSHRSPQECERSAGGFESHGWGRLADRLNLTTEQRASLSAIDDKYRPELRDLRQLLSDNRKTLTRMDATDPKLQELAEAQGKTLADVIVLRKNILADVDKVLSDDQRRQFHELFERGTHRGRDAMGNDSTVWKPAAPRSVAT